MPAVQKGVALTNLSPGMVGTPGAIVASATSVATPTTLAPALPTNIADGHVVLCFTTCRSATPTVATPTSWAVILNLTGTNGRLALFARVKDPTWSAAPSVVWSGLTTGTAGTPVQAQCAAARDLKIISNVPVLDVTGTVANGAASTSSSAGGAAVTTVLAEDLVLALSTRLDDAGTWTAPAGFTTIGAGGTPSGADMAQAWAWKVKSPAGSEAAADFGLSGATSFASSGVMVAFAFVGPGRPGQMVVMQAVSRSHIW